MNIIISCRLFSFAFDGFLFPPVEREDNGLEIDPHGTNGSQVERSGPQVIGFAGDLKDNWKAGR